MNPERWNRARAILDEALDKSPSEREAFVEEACENDPALLAAVRTLLRAHGEATAILDESTRTLPPSEATDGQFRPGEVIGKYTIREKIGKGAFGDVYRASQSRPVVRDSVALKIVKLEMLSDRVLARFEAERQALARMDHPDIAKVFDAGTTRYGRPYFVMEYVKGISITTHCDRHRVGIAGRLDLFMKVCDAVQHAHQKGIIHRDLKPSNILVSFDGDRVEPKVIDFGVAKALERPLTERTLFTEIGQLIGTPEYMSPEQAEMSQQDIDSRSDIYSLGVLLYELLTGMRPFDQQRLREAGFDEMRRIIREENPQRPSTRLSTISRSKSEDSIKIGTNRGLEPRTLGSKVRGDLDWITMKCLEKDRVHRYASASELAADIKRHLENEPVFAGPPSRWYKAKKFTRRNKRSIAVASVLLAAALALGFQTAKRVRAETISNRAQAVELAETAGFLKYQYPDQAEELLDRADALAPDLIDAKIERAYWRTLRQKFDEAEQMTRDILDRHPDSGEATALLAALVERKTPKEAESILNRFAGGVPEWRLFFARGIVEPDDAKAIELLKRSRELRRWQFDTVWQLAVRRFEIGDFKASLEDGELLANVRPELAIVQILFGASLWEVGKKLDPGEQQVEMARKARPAYDRAIELDPTQKLAYFNRALIYGSIASDKTAPKDVSIDNRKAAIADLGEALRLDPDHKESYHELGKNLFALDDRWREAEASLDKAIALGLDTWKVYADRAEARFEAKTDGAGDDADRAIKRFPDEKKVESRQWSHLLEIHGVATMRQGDLESALEHIDASIKFYPEEQSNEFRPDEYSRLHQNRGEWFWRSGRYLDALEPFETAASTSPDPLPEVGLARWFVGDLDGAIEEITRFIPAAEEDGPWIQLWIWDLESLRGNAENAGDALEVARSAKHLDLLQKAIHSDSSESAESDLFEAARAEGRHLANVLHWLGARGEKSNDLDKARRWFKACQATDPALEYHVCTWHLRRLDDSR